MVPVLDQDRQPLMPCSEKRARKLLDRKDAKPYWMQGIFCIILTREPSSRHLQEVGIGIDPGSKRTGITVGTHLKVVCNVLIDTPSWIKDKVEFRKTMRRARRNRNTPYRKCRYNRSIGGIPPSTKARWDAHLRVVKCFQKITPLSHLIIEDIAAVTKKGARRWNVNFSPLEVGKTYFEKSVKDLGLRFYTAKGYDTKDHRLARGFKKTKEKLKDVWEAHNVDSHSLLEIMFTHIPPFRGILRLSLLNYYRRQLTKANPIKGHRFIPYGGTLSLGIKRGTLVHYPKYGLCLVGGNSKNRISLHCLTSNRRLTQSASVERIIRVFKRLHWRSQFLPSLKEGVSLRGI